MPAENLTSQHWWLQGNHAQITAGMEWEGPQPLPAAPRALQDNPALAGGKEITNSYQRNPEIQSQDLPWQQTTSFKMDSVVWSVFIF